MFGYLLGVDDDAVDDENRVICRSCFSLLKKFTVVSVDSVIPPGLNGLNGELIQVSSIHNINTEMQGVIIVCNCCGNLVGVLENGRLNLDPTEMLYYHHVKQIVFRFDNKTTFINGIPNPESAVRQFIYAGPDGYVCRSCYNQKNAERLLALDFPLPDMNETALVVRPPNLYHNNMTYVPVFDLNVDLFQLEDDYPVDQLVCPVCKAILGHNVQEIAPGGVEVYWFTFEQVLYRRFESYFSPPGMQLYLSPDA